MATQEKASRKIHLDFHTPHWVKNVGVDYDPEELVRTWKKANVNAVTVVLGLCACGNAYYDSDIAPVHPGLHKDMLTPLLPIARREGIEVYVHFGPGINDRAVIEHPEWAMVMQDGKPLDTNGGVEWGWPCYNSPYIEEWFWPQIVEFAPRFPDASGIFIDMVTFPPGTCICTYCLQKAEELNYDLNNHDQLIRFQTSILNDFMSKTRTIIKSFNPEMEFTCNNQWYVGGARSESLDFIELEAPVSWNSYHYPVMARYIRTLPIASGGMTTRFPKNWGYFGSLNNETQLKFECSTMMATLGSCCIGDQLHPTGRTEAGVYELIGTIYEFVGEREAWVLHAKSVPYIALMADNQPNIYVTIPNSADQASYQGSAAFYGAGLCLLEGNRHFDVLDQVSDMTPYQLIWFAENKIFDPAKAEAVKQFVANGGRLLITGNSLWQVEEWKAVLEEMAGVKYVGSGDPGGSFIQPQPEYAAGIPQIPYYIKDSFAQWEIDPNSDAIVVAKVVEPYEEIKSRKFGHFHAPADKDSIYPGAIFHNYGKGKVAVIAAALAADYFTIGSGHVRKLVLNVLDALLDDNQKLVEVMINSPSIEVSLMSQVGRWILHLIQYGAKRQSGYAGGNTVIEELPIRNSIPVSFRPPAKPQRVYLAPSQQELQWTWEDGQVATVVPELHIHQMVVLEF